MSNAAYIHEKAMNSNTTLIKIILNIFTFCIFILYFLFLSLNFLYPVLDKINHFPFAYGSSNHDDDDDKKKKSHHNSIKIPDNKNTNPDNVDTSTSRAVIKGQGLIIGTNQDNYIIGSELDDTIYGKNGNDVVLAIGGDDSVYAGGDDDTIYGGDGNNQLFGEDDSDNVVGGPFNDLLSGGKGDDHLVGLSGDDVMLGGPGADYFECSDGQDSVLDYSPSQGDIVSNSCEIVNNIG